MRENNRNPIEKCRKKLPQFTTMNVIDGQAGLVIYSSLIFYSLTIDNILNIIVAANDMNVVREYLKNNNLYIKDFDSIMFDYNKNKIDYGIDCIIDGITVNFAPFVIANNNIIQKNFLSKQSSGINALVTVTLNNVKIEDCTTTIIIDQVKIKTYNLEMVRIMKEKSNKPKDVVDIEVIDEYGYDEKKYNDLKIKTNNMKFKIFPKSKLLRLFMK